VGTHDEDALVFSRQAMPALQRVSGCHHPSAALENRGAVLKLWVRGGPWRHPCRASQPLACAKCYKKNAGERCVTRLAAVERGVDDKNGCLDVRSSILGHDAAPAALRETNFQL